MKRMVGVHIGMFLAMGLALATSSVALADTVGHIQVKVASEAKSPDDVGALANHIQTALKYEDNTFAQASSPTNAWTYYNWMQPYLAEVQSELDQGVQHLSSLNGETISPGDVSTLKTLPKLVSTLETNENEEESEIRPHLSGSYFQTNFGKYINSSDSAARQVGQMAKGDQTSMESSMSHIDLDLQKLSEVVITARGYGSPTVIAFVEPVYHPAQKHGNPFTPWSGAIGAVIGLTIVRQRRKGKGPDDGFDWWGNYTDDVLDNTTDKVRERGDKALQWMSEQAQNPLVHDSERIDEFVRDGEGLSRAVKGAGIIGSAVPVIGDLVRAAISHRNGQLQNAKKYVSAAATNTIIGVGSWVIGTAVTGLIDGASLGVLTPVAPVIDIVLSSGLSIGLSWVAHAFGLPT